MRKSIIYSIVFLVMVSVSSSKSSAQELLSSTFSRDTILIGDQVEWGVRLNVPKELTIWVDSLLNPVVPGVELIRDYSFDTISNKRDYIDVDMKAIITSFDSGSYYLPRQVVYFYKGEELIDTLVINERTLEVTTIPIDTTTYQMYDIKPPFRYPVTVGEVIPWVCLGLLLVALAYIVFRVVKNRRENKSLFGKPAVQDPPHITALRSLERIRGEKLWQNNKEKQFYTEVTDVVRMYVEARYRIPTLERTSKEIMDALTNECGGKVEFEELKELFDVADLVKFAKYKASEGENERAIPTAVRFVNATFMQDLENESNNSKEVSNG